MNAASRLAATARRSLRATALPSRAVLPPRLLTVASRHQFSTTSVQAAKPKHLQEPDDIDDFDVEEKLSRSLGGLEDDMMNAFDADFDSQLNAELFAQFENQPAHEGPAAPKTIPLTPRQMGRVRIVPDSPSYFTAQPVFTDGFLKLRSLLIKYAHLPTVDTNGRSSWQNLTEYRIKLGESVRASKYRKVLEMLQRLNRIRPEVMPQEVTEALQVYKRMIDPTLNKPKPIKIDRFGRALAVGRRKTSTARAWVVEGTGEVLVNGKPLTAAFGRVHDRESAVWALKATERLGKYNVWALVEGGGTTGQAEALTLAVAKALLAHEPDLKPALRRAGCVTRDPRNVERKKPGHVKARKMPAWVAR